MHLHSTMVLLKSNDGNRYEFLDGSSTFHYGSIKIIDVGSTVTGINVSTFHYGSIKILFTRKHINSNANLHSTMVLLKSNAPHKVTHVVNIYIPLWFY